VRNAEGALRRVAELLGGRLLRARRLGGLSNDCYMVLVERGGALSKYSVKLYSGRDALTKMRREVAAFRLLSRHGLPAPEIVATDEGSLVGLPVVVWRWLEGRTAESLIDRSPVLARALGTVLARIHRLPLSELDTGLFRARRDLWAEEAAVVRALARALGEEALAEVADVAPSTEPSALALLHCDYNPGNIVVSGGRVYVLDFEGACIGDPMYDVAYALVFLLSRRVKRRAIEFAAGYFEASGAAPEGLGPRLSLCAAKLHLILRTPAFADAIRGRAGALYPLFRLFASMMAREAGRVARGELRL